MPETIELLNCTKKRMYSGIKVPQTILKLRKGMGYPVSFDLENCTSNNYYTKMKLQYFLSPYFSGIKAGGGGGGGGERNHT